jgi:ABC-type amino acid transport substrate-binding protein
MRTLFRLLALCLLPVCLLSACGRRDSVGGSPDLWASSTIMQVKGRGKAVVLMEAQFKPFTWKDAGVLKGFDVDLARAIGAELEVDVEFRESAFDLLANELVEGKGDLVISGVTATPLRGRRCAFTDPYYLTRTIALVSTKRAGGVKTLAGSTPSRRIIAQSGSTGRPRRSATGRAWHARHGEPVRARGTQGRADAFIYDLPGAEHAKQHFDTTFVIGETLSIEPYAIEPAEATPSRTGSTLPPDHALTAGWRLLCEKHLPGIAALPSLLPTK